MNLNIKLYLLYIRRTRFARQQADWLVGINGTRLFTVLYKNKVLKVGRVQTPTLAMMVQRETEIMNFKKTPYYTLVLDADGLTAVSDKYDTENAANQAKISCSGQNAKVSSIKKLTQINVKIKTATSVYATPRKHATPPPSAVNAPNSKIITPKLAIIRNGFTLKLFHLLLKKSFF